MRKDSVVFGVAGIFFGFLVGWIIRDQRVTDVAPAPAQAPQAQTAPARQAPPSFDESAAAALKVTADRNPSDAETRVLLGNMYFDGERYPEAVTWYESALKVNPKHVNASTDLGIAYYYSNQPDRALAQFDRSLAIDPRHSKTLLNVGIVRAFAKQDLAGAEKAWQQVLDVAPNSPEAALAKQGLEGLRSARPTPTGTPPAGKPPGGSD